MRTMRIRRILCLLLAVICLCTLTFPAYAEGEGETQSEGETGTDSGTRAENSGVAINDANFPDANFRSYVSENIDTDKNGALSADELSACTEINVSGQSITSLKGIEYFTNLTSLNCYYCKLTTLDVSANTALTGLWCSSNSLTSLNVSGCTALTTLSCRGNRLTALDVSGCTALETLMCGSNELTSLNISGCANLSTCDISDQNAHNIVTENGTYEMPGNFDADEVSNLDGGEFSGKTLTVTAATEPSGYAIITYTYNAGQSKRLSCTLYAYPAVSADNIEINEQNFPDANFRSYVSGNVDADKNGVLSSAELSLCTEISVSGKSITSLKGIEYFANLTSLYCSNNKLTTLDVSANTALTGLWCSDNYLTSLNVKGCTALMTLYCSGNRLTALDLSGCAALSYYSWRDNKLVTLDVSGCTSLTSLNCGGSSDNHGCLTSLNASGCTALKTLNCAYNELTSLNISGCVNLSTCDISNQNAHKVATVNYVYEMPGCFEAHKVSNDISGGGILGKRLRVTAATGSDGYATVTYSYDAGENTTVSCTVHAYPLLETDAVAINEQNFPDENFRGYVSDVIDRDDDGELSAAEITVVSEISIKGKSVSSLKGIEFFTNLRTLDCSDNKLTALDLKEAEYFGNLRKLDCGNNALAALNVGGCAALEELICGNNSLTGLDVSSNAQLATLDCDNNLLAALDVSNNGKLSYLNCSYNQLTSLDISATSVGNLYANDNERRMVTEGNTFDLSTLPGFDADRVLLTEGCEIKDNVITITAEAGEDGYSEVSYLYDVGKGKSIAFIIRFVDSNHEHTWIAATCTEPKTCSVCGKTEGEPAGHTVETVPGKAATATESGLTTGKVCSVCGAVLVKQRVIPANGTNITVDETVLDDNAYTVEGPVVTINCAQPCKVGYRGENGAYIAIPAEQNGDGSYSFVAPEGVTNVIIVMKGDVDSDGDVDSSDVTRLKAAFLGKVTLTDAQEFAGDLDDDGDVDSSDVTRLKAIYLRKTAPEW